MALGEPVLSASHAASCEGGYESVEVGVLTCFHLLNRDIFSFRFIIHLDGRHVAACLDTLMTFCLLGIRSQVLALLGRDIFVMRWPIYWLYICLCVYE